MCGSYGDMRILRGCADPTGICGSAHDRAFAAKLSGRWAAAGGPRRDLVIQSGLGRSSQRPRIGKTRFFLSSSTVASPSITCRFDATNSPSCVWSSCATPLSVANQIALTPLRILKQRFSARHHKRLLYVAASHNEAVSRCKMAGATITNAFAIEA